MNKEKHIKPTPIKKGAVNEAKDRSDSVEPDKYGSCIKRCNEKLHRNPRDEFAYIERGDAQLYLVNPKDALIDYRRAIQINPNLIKAYYGMATAHVMVGSYKNAMLVLIKAKAMELEQQLTETV